MKIPYCVERCAYSTQTKAETKFDERETIHIHFQLWEPAEFLKEAKLPPAIQSLFITSVNEIINLSDQRKTVALVFRIPNVLWTA